MKKVEAYQTSDGRKFLTEPEARRHEEEIRYRAKRREIEDYLYDLLGITGVKDGEDREDQLCNMLVEESRSDLCHGANHSAIGL